VGFLADQRDPALVAALAEALHGAKSRQRGADHNDSVESHVNLWTERSLAG
jgi:hypothetical protein